MTVDYVGTRKSSNTADPMRTITADNITVLAPWIRASGGVPLSCRPHASVKYLGWPETVPGASQA